jgi:hypothetical protein
MATIGRITIPTTAPSTSFPLRTDFAHGMTIGRTVVAHTFADGSEQRFYVGNPATRYTFVRRVLPRSARATLAAFWQATQGGVLPFSYDVPQQDQSFVTKTVRFENAPLSLEDLSNAITSVGLTFVEVPDPSAAPVYATSASVTRFPDSTLASALCNDVQEIIPLVHIRVLDSAVPDIYLSDRLLTLDGQVYQPRLLRVGEPGGDVLMEQSIDGSNDDVQFSFGNADRVMIALANDTDLINARIELSLLHVGSLRKLDLWAGIIMDWSSDAGPEFTVHAADILSALTLSSPVGSCSRSCWRRYGMDGCPATPGTQALDLVHFPNADASSCDLGYETDNGCLAHSGGDNPTIQSYGGVWADPQQVRILDNSTGVLGIGRSTITPTSEISDSLWGQSLPEIWHSDDGIVQRGLPVAARLAEGRDESDFYAALGVVGKGPMGAFTVAQMVDTDGDGVKETFVGSTLDGQPHHGFKTDSIGNSTGNNDGLFQCVGNDPAGAGDFFSLDRVGSTPDNWMEVVSGASVFERIYAAGVAFCEIRRTDQPGVQLSTLDSHSMQVVISQGLTALAWTAPGAQTTIQACTNPFWVAVNTFLRAIGMIDADAATQETYFDVDAAVAAAATADEQVPGLFGTILTPIPSDPTTDVCNAGSGQTEFSMAHVPLAAPTVSFKPGGGSDPVSKTVSVAPDSSGDFVWTPGYAYITANFAINQDDEVDITYQYASGLYSATTPNENQFRFKGVVDASKPTRDWLRDILNNALGYFTWTFGKLKLGCRNTATPTSTFQAGNILFNTLRLAPIKPGFEKLTIDFADEEYLFAHNTVVYVDQDYAGRHNRIQNPHAAEFGLVGCSTKSQASRIAVCRTREELGGVGAAEQTGARRATWSSTILALDVDAGAVASILDAEVNGGAGSAFRVQRWRLNRDWSVDLVGNTVTESMYDLTAGPVPAAVSEQVQPTSAPHDSGPPPAPAFSLRQSPVDPCSLEIYGLSFAQTANTLTISSATFTVNLNGAAPQVVTANFPPDFFSSAAAAAWSLKVYLPGKEVLSVAGLVANSYGSSPAFTVTATISLADSALISSSGGGTPGDAAVFDSTGAIADAGAPPALDGGGAKTNGDVAVYNASGRLVDGGGAPVLKTRQVATTAPLTGGGDLSADRTLGISNFTGDSGSGGAAGAVPAPGAGDASGGKYLKADGSWAVPPGVPTSRKINTAAPLTGGGDLSADRTLAISAFTGDSGSGGAAGAVPAPQAGDAAAGKVLGAGGAWIAAGSGTVTHAGGALTADEPVFGNGSGDVKVGTKTGNTDQVVTATGAATANYPLLYDANGNAIAVAPQGNTTKVQMAGTGTPSVGQPLLYDANGNAVPGTTAQLVPALPSDGTKYLNGLGAFTVPAGGSAGAWTKLTEVIVSGSVAANISFSAISQSYRHLHVKLVGRADANQSDTDVYMQFNGDTGANYDYMETYNGSYQGSWAITAMRPGGLAGATAPANYPGSLETTIYDYARTVFIKNCQGLHMRKYGTTAGYVMCVACNWRNTAAITSILLFPSTGNFVVGTIAQLYGIS